MKHKLLFIALTALMIIYIREATSASQSIEEISPVRENFDRTTAVEPAETSTPFPPARARRKLPSPIPTQETPAPEAIEKRDAPSHSDILSVGQFEGMGQTETLQEIGFLLNMTETSDQRLAILTSAIDAGLISTDDSLQIILDLVDEQKYADEKIDRFISEHLQTVTDPSLQFKIADYKWNQGKSTEALEILSFLLEMDERAAISLSDDGSETSSSFIREAAVKMLRDINSTLR